MNEQAAPLSDRMITFVARSLRDHFRRGHTPADAVEIHRRAGFAPEVIDPAADLFARWHTMLVCSHGALSDWCPACGAEWNTTTGEMLDPLRDCPEEADDE
ncbi:MAG: hypothetical protein EKK55_08495 [Rhodocyclaceae bacterium]|nr:MAG: hypothetical protein EKK55_08495 [Rhodocyclaceae bacterium]